LPFWITVLLIAIMGVATIIEKHHGMEFVHAYIYGAWWFTYVWALLAVLSLMGIIKSGTRNTPMILLHLSLIIILVGAGCTKALSKQGHIVITKNAYSNIVHNNNDVFSLPFSIKLDTFYVSYYSGTNAPADYTSNILVYDKSGDNVNAIKASISMNNIYKYKGYRFYQSSFEDDWNTSVLSVNYDVVGGPLSYAGYFLFMLSMLWLMFSPKNAFRKLLKHPLLKNIAVVVFISVPIFSHSQTITNDNLTVEKTQSDAFGNIWILNEGRIMPIFVFANDFSLKILNKNSYKYMDATQFLMGMLFFHENWKNIPLFKIEDKLLRSELKIKGSVASLSDFFDNGKYKLSKYWPEINSKEYQTPYIKEIERLNDKIQLVEMLKSARLLQIFPQKEESYTNWLYPSQNLETIENIDAEFIAQSLPKYFEMLKKGNENEAIAALNKIKTYQKTEAEELLPSENHRKAEKFYLKTNLISLLFKINLSIGILSLLSVLVLSNKRQKQSNTLFYAILIILFVICTAYIALRTYIAGRLPFSNGYETMLLTAWCGMLIAFIFGKKIPVIVSFGFLLSGCTLLVAHIGAMNPKITPLVPVLSSPLLSFHVSVIMLSYALFGFIALNSITSFIHILIAKKEKAHATMLMLERNKIYSQICLYPAIFLLGSGIFLGAIWANISWGRYWGWDPKEVWALITLLLYSLVLHKKVTFLNSLFAFHTFGLLAFLSVLMTYFGVNYILGGIHSYAGDMQAGHTFVVVLLLVSILLLFIGVSYFKYRGLISFLKSFYQ